MLQGGQVTGYTLMYPVCLVRRPVLELCVKPPSLKKSHWISCLKQKIIYKMILNNKKNMIVKIPLRSYSVSNGEF